MGANKKQQLETGNRAFLHDHGIPATPQEFPASSFY
jgi:hypothetical protein